MRKRKKTGSDSQIVHVSTELAGKTLASVVKTRVGEVSWNRIRSLISARHVQVNGNLSLDGSRRVKEGEVVKIFEHPLAPPPRAEDIEIVYIDPHLVIVNKPAGITSVKHARDAGSKKRKQLQPTLEELMPDLLLRRGGAIIGVPNQKPPRKKKGPGPYKPPRPTFRPKVFPVHRLDRDTSGLIMFALSTTVQKNLEDMFRVHSIDRTYRAVCRGNVRGQTIESKIARDRGDGLRGSRDESDDSEQSLQNAITHVRPVKGLGKHTLVECRLETGRTHQIRIHLSEQGHLVCGEKTYVRQKDGKVIHDTSGAPRLALHAHRLEFLHPILQKKIVVECPIPRELEDFIKRLSREKRPSSKTPSDQHD